MGQVDNLHGNLDPLHFGETGLDFQEIHPPNGHYFKGINPKVLNDR
jgi:hypothetical protein